jgi:hypothetical protein
MQLERGCDLLDVIYQHVLWLNRHHVVQGSADPGTAATSGPSCLS